MNTCAILLGGDMHPTERLRSQLDGARFIAADGGIRHSDDLGIDPDLWVGDFDSTSEELLERYENTPRRSFPPQKGMTDGEIAIEMALDGGADRLILIGALSGERSDHALAHYVSALALRQRGIDIFLSSGTEEAYPLVSGRYRFPLPVSSLFSIVGFEDVSGLHIENAVYPLEDHFLAFGSSRTISNVALGDITIRIGTGRALLLARPYDLSGV